MSTIKAFTALSLAVASPALSNARQAEVMNFNKSSRLFQLIEPDFGPARTSDPDSVAEASDTRKLDRALASLANEPAFKPTTTIVEHLTIPAWMRSSTKGLVPVLNLPNSTSISSKSCDAVQYAPHPTLAASQEHRRQRYFQQMAAAACGARVPVELLDALIIQESRYNPLALSSKGASGLTQLMPGTARSLGVFDRWSVSQNLSGGARYLRKQLDSFGNWELALGAYNAGPGNVTKYGGLPPFRETRDYVQAILASINAYRSSRGRIGKLPFGRKREVMLASFNQ